MQNLEGIKTAGQENFNRLVALGKQQPPEVKTWGVTAGAAVAGGLVMAAGAQGLLAIVAALASTPVSLTVGAIGGGVLGWLYMERQKETSKGIAVEDATVSDPAPQVIAIEPIAAESIAPVTVTHDEVLHTEVNTELAGQSSIEPVVTDMPVSDVPLASDSPNSLASDNPTPEQIGEPMMAAPEIATESQPSEPVIIEAAPTESVSTIVGERPIHRDKLEEINGIGRVFANRLHASGIYTFAQLAELTPEQLQTIMASSRGGQLIDAASWIEQARQLAADSQA